MPNISSILKAEISRVARKEVRAEIETLKKSVVAQRASIAALRRQVEVLEKELRRAARAPTRSAAVDDADDADSGPKRRFSPTRLAAHRSKLGLSAVAYGKLIGVSSRTIYQWEHGRVRPRAAQLERIAAVRTLNAGEAAKGLASA